MVEKKSQTNAASGVAAPEAHGNRAGRKPIGKPISVILATADWNKVEEVAARYGRRRQSAVIRAAARRLVQDSNPVARIRDYLGSIESTPEPFVPMNVSIGGDLISHLDQLGASVGISRAAVIRVAIARLIADPSNLVCELRPESWREPTGHRSVKVRPDHRNALDALMEPFGARLRSAAVRVAVKRLLAHPEHLLRDHHRHEDTRANLPVDTVQTRVVFDAELRENTTSLSAVLGVSRSMLVRTAVAQLLHDQDGLDNEIIAEIYQDGPNRDTVINRYRRRYGTSG